MGLFILPARLKRQMSEVEYLLNNRSLAVDLAPGEIISYNNISQHLTKDEYDHLIELSNDNGYDTNDLIYYHTFLKEYLIGNGKLNDVKKLIKNNEKDLKEYAKKGKKIKISYEVKKDELYITKIK